MHQYHYTPIITVSTRAIFLDYINAFKLGSIDYFAVGLGSTTAKKLTSISSLPEWQDHLYKKQLAKSDPVIIAKIFSQRNIVPFSELDYINSRGNEVMQQRRLFGIQNGLLLIHQKRHLRYMVMLATGYSKFDHYAFLKKYYAKLGRLKHDLIKIIEKDTKQFFLN
ncbi:MAG: autoinducer binding domain-containing protein [Pseudomonadota bacterium]